MQTGKSRGFALFVYKTQEGARKVLEEPYKMFEGHQLHCKRAAEGKNKVVASVTTTVQPILQPPVLAAAQNLAMFNPMYGGLLANPDAAFLAAAGVNPLGLGPGVLGSSVGLGVGGYDGAALGSLGGNQSVLGAYGGGSSAPMLQGLQHAYPNSQMGQSSTTKAQGAGGGSFGVSQSCEIEARRSNILYRIASSGIVTTDI
ncbi:hypothetical protein RJ639_016852 [Escallonia herrerae]|uniref:Uncharacterized protein n=1 Tax=Escallonia herrerae TaxID=1293975 RepID=A0AA89AKD7_9ASTE|nr:hypothetical protein RJ639_016852 [Escallonia herrerae]